MGRYRRLVREVMRMLNLNNLTRYDFYKRKDALLKIKGEKIKASDKKE
jgi:hypothetical protein